jgi:hypothetical protein
MQFTLARFLSEHPYFVSDLGVFTYKVVYESFTNLCLYIFFLFSVSRIHPVVPYYCLLSVLFRLSFHTTVLIYWSYQGKVYLAQVGEKSFRN